MSEQLLIIVIIHFKFLWRPEINKDKFVFGKCLQIKYAI